MKLLNVSAFALLISAFSSCEKVIHVDLHNATAQYVIEANINDKPGPYSVKITRTKNFDGNNEFPYVSNAFVVITDNNTISDTLIEKAPGLYQTTHITGTHGHTYHLYVKIGNRVFSASSTMPTPIPLDSIYAARMSDFDGTHISGTPVFTDPAAKGNKYHLVQYVNDTATNDIFVLNDDFLNGTLIALPLQSPDTKIKAGDKLAIELQAIDPSVFNYYYSLSSNKDVATPANPVTNISGGSLGYFSAYSSSLSKTIIVQ